MARKPAPKPAAASGSGEAGQRDVISFLSDPGAYGPEERKITLCETHGAIVFLAGDLAYKMKRAVRFSYMDFSTLELRRQVILRELAINKPHAPEIYLDAVAVTREPGGALRIGGTGAPVEWLLVMRRFPESDLLSEKAAHGPLDAILCKELADAVYAFHREAPADAAADTPSQLRAIVRQVADALSEAVPHITAGDTGRFRDTAEAEVTRTATLLKTRARDGYVRRCHGDLHLGNIVLWGGHPVLFDAIEFDERLATVDTLYDLAFLLMDLVQRGQRSGSNQVLNRYLWRSNSRLDLAGLAALPLFLALRAGVRAMVAAQRAGQKDGAEAGVHYATARGYLAAAIEHLAPSEPRLVAVGGLSGTGKSTLAAALAPSIGRAPGAVHLRSDLERKALFSAGETERLPPEAYKRAAGEKVYAVLLEKAREALAAGQSVITDAVYAKSGERADIERVARSLGVPFTGFWLEAPREVLIARVEARRGDASDATREVVEKQLTYESGLISWTRIEASGSAAGTLATAQTELDRTTSNS